MNASALASTAIGAYEPVRQAIVLAGGLGTRLGPLTKDVPKPLLPVGGRPFLEWVLANLERHGVTEVVLAVGYLAGFFEGWLASYQTRLAVSMFVEREPLGTGGALPLLSARLQDRFYVLNGDTLFDVDYGTLGAAADGPSGVATSGASDSRAPGETAGVALRFVPDVARYGRVRLEGDRVVGFDEKTATGPGWINGGVYALSRRHVVGLGSPSSIESDLLPPLAAEGRLLGVPQDGFFLDIGVPDTYESAQSSVPAWWQGRS